jgi:hypothetical protein
MIYHAENMILSSIREVFCGKVNDVFICRDLNSPTRRCYTLLVIKDRSCAKSFLMVLENNEKSQSVDGQPYLCRFTQNEDLCFVFEYREERRLSAFGQGQMTSAYIRERICVNLLMECLSSPLPNPMLYLVLTQNNIHIEKDNSIYFTPYFDLSELKEDIGEAVCAKICAGVLLELLESGTRKKLKSYELIRKKLERNAYQSFPELYMDIRATEIPETNLNFRERLAEFWKKIRDPLFRLLLILSVIAAIVALICIICQIIFGDIPFLRIFQHSFDVIGTETLK